MSKIINTVSFAIKQRLIQDIYVLLLTLLNNSIKCNKDMHCLLVENSVQTWQELNY